MKKLAILFLLPSILVLILLSPQIFHSMVAQARSYEDDLYVTSSLWFEDGIYPYLIQGEDGSVFSVSRSHILKIETDGTMRFFHLVKFVPCSCTITDGKIHIYSNSTVYRYDENGKYLDHYPLNDFEKFPKPAPLDSVKVGNKTYTRYRNAQAHTTGVQVMEGEDGSTSKVIFWALEPQEWSRIIGAFSIFSVITADIYLFCYLHWRKRKPGKYLKKNSN